MAPEDLALAQGDLAKDQLASHVEEATGGDVVVERLLGGGRTGLVYVAEQLTLDRKVAVKVLLPRHAQDPKSVIRFKREARAMAGCPHPGIVSVYSVGETANGLPFFVMEYIEGETLLARLKRKGKLPLQEVARIARAIGDALSYAHSRGLIHRDVRPANVLIETGSGRVLLTDFGMAKLSSGTSRAVTLTGTGEIMGSPAYLSPEQAECGVVDARSDQYSLAVLTYEMLSGRLPFDGPTPQDYIRQQAEETPLCLLRVEPAMPVEVSRVVDRGLMKEPGARYNSAAAFAEALGAAASSAPAPGNGGQPQLWLGFERQLIQATAIYAGVAWGVLEALTWVLETFDASLELRQPALWVVLGAFPLVIGLVWCRARASRSRQAELAVQ
jgi:serine/threonine-protein kinase